MRLMSFYFLFFYDGCKFELEVGVNLEYRVNKEKYGFK